MKTFVLIALSALPTALAAQVLVPPSSSASASPAPLSLSLGEFPPENEDEPAPQLSTERPPLPSAPDFKLRVIRPRPADVPRMRIARPDARYDYKILTPEPAPTRRAETPRRSR